MPTFPQKVNIVEVGPRDGLQNEATPVATEAKIAFIKALAAAGLAQIEAGSFVHPKLVPQLADAEAIFANVAGAPGPVYSALVPNERGLDRAIAAGVRRIAVFTAASETFTQKNIGMTIDESLAVFRSVTTRALSEKMSVRAYVSTAFVCPFEGKIDKRRIADLSQKLFELGADEVAISDTIGAAVPSDIFNTVGHVLLVVPDRKIALHFHDTYGTALANVLAGLELGVTTFDSSAGGLGGCPFAPGASGNLATEDLVYMLHGMGIQTGVNMEAVIDAADAVSLVLGHALSQCRLAAQARVQSGKRALPEIGLMQAFYFDTVDSTNNLARSMLQEEKIRDQAYIVAREQTAGRGNRGRSWLSPLDAGIYLTVIDRPKIGATNELHAFTRSAGIACAETIHACAGVAVRLKPINDLYADGRKLGGILTEAVIEQLELRALITGVGINVRRADRPLPPGQVQPICLEEVMPAVSFASLDLPDIIVRLVKNVLHWNGIVAGGENQTLESQWRRFSTNGDCCVPTAPRAVVDE